MALTGLSFQNYKAFPGTESIEIRPLTILIGRNSSGKSAIARLPLLLAASFSKHAQAPLALEVEGVDFGASFVDLNKAACRPMPSGTSCAWSAAMHGACPFADATAQCRAAGIVRIQQHGPRAPVRTRMPRSRAARGVQGLEI